MNLTPEEINKLKLRHKKERDGKVRDRIKAVLLINDGYTFEQISKILLIDDATVRRHVVEFMLSEKLTNRHKGSESKLSKHQTAELIIYLKGTTFLDLKPIINHVFSTYGITYTQSGMTAWLKAHGFRYKKPHTVPSKHNPAKQQEFIDEIAQVINNHEQLFYLDATHPSHQSKLAFGWIFKGSNKALPTTATQKRIH